MGPEQTELFLPLSKAETRPALPIAVMKQLKGGKPYLESQFEGTVHHGNEGVAA